MIRACRQIGLLTALLLAAGAGCSRPQPQTVIPPLRLIERLDQAEIVRPPGGRLDPPRALGQPAIDSLADRPQVARVAMYGEAAQGSPKLRPEGHENRLALLAPSGARYRFPIEVPPDAVLRLGLGYVPPPAGEESAVRFEVAVESAAGRTELLSREVEVSARGSWRDLELSLREWSGRAVALELATHAPADRELVWAAWSAPEVLSSGRPQPGWDVVLVSLDTLRADRLGCYGYERPTSPRLDALARRSARFETAVSQSPWTRPSHRSLFSGLYPTSRQGLDSPPLAAVLWQAGYKTRALTAGGQLHFRFGFQAGFEEYRISNWIRQPDLAADWLRRHPQRRQFIFLHTYEIHDPFTHHEFTGGLPQGRIGESFSLRDYGRLRRDLTGEEKLFVEALYDGGIAFTDRRLGQLLDDLEGSGALERAIVIVTSDHGEQFWEHGSFRHGQNMYDHQLLVPLIVYLPPALRRQLGLAAASRGTVVAQQVRLVDLYPTVLDLLGIPLAHPVQGRSLRPLLAGESLPPVDAFAENTNRATELKALRTPAYKLVQVWGTDRRELFDLRADPLEQMDVARRHPELTQALASQLLAITAGSDEAERDQELPSEIDPELREQLEALGYLGNG